MTNTTDPPVTGQLLLTRCHHAHPSAETEPLASSVRLHVHGPLLPVRRPPAAVESFSGDLAHLSTEQLRHRVEAGRLCAELVEAGADPDRWTPGIEPAASSPE